MRCKRMVDVGRRQFLQGGLVAGAGAAAAVVAQPAGAQMGGAQTGGAQTGRALVDYPSERLANLADLTENEPLDILYPDEDSPGVLLKLGRAVEGGAGPDGDVVAFSVICPHQGYYMLYNAEDRTMNCPGHYSRFDVEAGGQQVWGQATQNLPQFALRVDEAGDIFGEGVDELLYGRVSNVL